jgi:hypothetical protein
LDDKQHPILKGKVPNVQQIAMATLSLRKKKKDNCEFLWVIQTSESTQVIDNVHHLNLGCHSTFGYLLLLLLFASKQI